MRAAEDTEKFGTILEVIDLRSRVYAVAFGAVDSNGMSTRVVSGVRDGKVCFLQLASCDRTDIVLMSMHHH